MLRIILLCIFFLGLTYTGCSESNSSDPEPTVYEYEAVRSPCDPLIIAIKANQSVTIRTTDSVHTNIGGVVTDCDVWTDADGIADCHYIDQISELHGLPFMALIGYFNEEYFLVGTSFKRTFNLDGNLELWVNDWGECFENSDNAGKFVISLLIE